MILAVITSEADAAVNIQADLTDDAYGNEIVFESTGTTDFDADSIPTTDMTGWTYTLSDTVLTITNGSDVTFTLTSTPGKGYVHTSFWLDSSQTAAPADSGSVVDGWKISATYTKIFTIDTERQEGGTIVPSNYTLTDGITTSMTYTVDGRYLTIKNGNTTYMSFTAYEDYRHDFTKFKNGDSELSGTGQVTAGMNISAVFDAPEYEVSLKTSEFDSKITVSKYGASDTYENALSGYQIPLDTTCYQHTNQFIIDAPQGKIIFTAPQIDSGKGFVGWDIYDESGTVIAGKNTIRVTQEMSVLPVYSSANIQTAGTQDDLMTAIAAGGYVQVTNDIEWEMKPSADGHTGSVYIGNDVTIDLMGHVIKIVQGETKYHACIFEVGNAKLSLINTVNRTGGAVASEASIYNGTLSTTTKSYSSAGIIMSGCTVNKGTVYGTLCYITGNGALQISDMTVAGFASDVLFVGTGDSWIFCNTALNNSVTSRNYFSDIGTAQCTIRDVDYGELSGDERMFRVGGRNAWCDVDSMIIHDNLARGGETVFLGHSSHDAADPEGMARAAMIVKNVEAYRNTTLKGNGDFTGTVFETEGMYYILDSYFHDNSSVNQAGVMWLGWSSYSEIRNCVFEDNTGKRGGAIAYTSKNGNVPGAFIYDCTFKGNSAQYGSAIAITGTTYQALHLEDCTFTDNFSTDSSRHSTIYMDADKVPLILTGSTDKGMVFSDNFYTNSDHVSVDDYAVRTGASPLTLIGNMDFGASSVYMTALPTSGIVISDRAFAGVFKNLDAAVDSDSVVFTVSPTSGQKASDIIKLVGLRDTSVWTLESIDAGRGYGGIIKATRNYPTVLEDSVSLVWTSSNIEEGGNTGTATALVTVPIGSENRINVLMVQLSTTAAPTGASMAAIATNGDGFYNYNLDPAHNVTVGGASIGYFSAGNYLAAGATLSLTLEGIPIDTSSPIGYYLHVAVANSDVDNRSAKMYQMYHLDNGGSMYKYAAVSTFYITTQPQPASYALNTTATALTVANGGTETISAYNWQIGTIVDDAYQWTDQEPKVTDSTFTPSTEASGTYYYRVVLTGSESTIVNSAPVKITVVDNTISYYLGQLGMTGTLNPRSPTVFNLSSETVLYDPVLTGYSGAWYTAYTGGSLVTSIPAGTTTAQKLYAVYTPNTYRITLDPLGGTMTTATTLTAVYKTSYPTLGTPTREGYDFGYWYLGVETNKIESGSDMYTAGDHTLYAKWYEIFDVDYLAGAAGPAGDVAEGSIESVHKSAKDAFVLPDYTGFTAPYGQSFDHWSVKIGSASATDKDPNDQIYVTGDTKVTAVWKTDVEFTMTIKLGGGSADAISGWTKVDDETFTVTGIYGTTATTPTGYSKAHCTQTAGDRAWQKASDSSYVASIPTTVTADETYTVQWTPDTYQLSWSSVPEHGQATAEGESTGQITIGTTPVEYTDSITVTITPESGYKTASFSWKNVSTGENYYVVPTAENQYKFVMPASDVQLKALIVLESQEVYDVTYGPTEHGTVSGPIYVLQGTVENISIVPEDGYRVGSVFISAGTGEVYRVNDRTWTLAPTSNVTVSASFTTADYYTITYSAGEGGTVTGSESVDIGGTALMFASPASGKKISSVTVEFGTYSRIADGVYAISPSASTVVSVTFADIDESDASDKVNVSAYKILKDSMDGIKVQVYTPDKQNIPEGDYRMTYSFSYITEDENGDSITVYDSSTISSTGKAVKLVPTFEKDLIPQTDDPDEWHVGETIISASVEYMYTQDGTEVTSVSPVIVL